MEVLNNVGLCQEKEERRKRKPYSRKAVLIAIAKK
jgi:hypothetical protein